MSFNDENTARTGTLSRAGGAVDDFVAGVKDQALELKEEYIDEGWNQTRDYVRQNPGKAILISAAIGAVLGGFLFSRNR